METTVTERFVVSREVVFGTSASEAAIVTINANFGAGLAPAIAIRVEE
jgi:hypothetical protein